MSGKQNISKNRLCESLLFPADELRTYNGVLPEGDSRIVSACDVAWGGGDALSMPIGREYENGDVYIFDWVFNRGTKEVTLLIVAGKMSWEIKSARLTSRQTTVDICTKVHR